MKLLDAKRHKCFSVFNLSLTYASNNSGLICDDTSSIGEEIMILLMVIRILSLGSKGWNCLKYM